MTLSTAVATPARLAERADLPRVVTTLSRAFFDDRMNRWIFPDDAQRRERAPAFWAAFTDACWTAGRVYIAGSAAGAALWVPPGTPLVPPATEEEFIGTVLDTAGSREAAGRMAQVMTMMGEHHPADDHWYLLFIGVDPSAQGRGLGSALLRTVLARADVDGMPAYLEASCEENRRFYERHGFRTTGELTVAGCPTMYAMWREPRS